MVRGEGWSKSPVVELIRLQLEQDNLRSSSSPPSLISSLMAGFDVVSNNISLILFSILLDLVIWFGPRLQMVRLFEPVLKESAVLAGIQDTETLDMLNQGVKQLNLFVSLRAFPVGIPSLMSGRLPTSTPWISQPIEIEVLTFTKMVGIWALLVLVGIALGTFYFSMVAQASLTDTLSFKKALSSWPRHFSQVLLLSLFMYALVVLLIIPLSCLLSGLMFVGVGMRQLPMIAALFLSAVIIWIFLPLFFSPHGIFAFGRTMWESMVHAVRLSRATISATGMFILVIVLLSEGLNVVWNLPKDDSWFMLVGIAGHAFITTGLLASTFIFYRDADLWLSELVRIREINQAG